MRQFNSIAIEQYNNKKIALGDNLKVRFSVVRKVFYPKRIDLPIPFKEGSYTFLYHKKGVTLVELLIAVCIFGLIVMGFSSIDTFSRYHVISSDRRAKLQNDASYILEHMAKEIAKAIGDVNNPTVDTSNIGGDAAVQVWIDFNQNGQRDAGDREIAYRFTGAPVAYQIKFCPECTNGPCTNCNPNWNSTEILSSRINSFSPTYSSTSNYVDINITACWDADGSPIACGSLDNPALVMKNRIYMPAVSTN